MNAIDDVKIIVFLENSSRTLKASAHDALPNRYRFTNASMVERISIRDQATTAVGSIPHETGAPQ